VAVILRLTYYLYVGFGVVKGHTENSSVMEFKVFTSLEIHIAVF
jgi:hypothetical protein